MTRVQNLTLKAERSFSAAERLLDEGDTDFAASRAYYGYFYVAEALLEFKDLAFSRHSRVIAQYGLHFAKPGVLDPKFHRLLRRAFNLRQLADYSEEASSFDPAEVNTLIEEGRRFLAAAEEYLQQAERNTDEPQ